MDITADLTVHLGKRIMEVRKHKNFSQEKLGLLTGIDKADISKYESGKINLTLKTLLRFAVALQVHPKELFNFEFDITKYKIDE
ncbi:helix-turn-helix domain-containing protein [Epilithonimonas pallida]|mgnify:CR=1 FL=1|uniref:Helix-turn-helix n=1 Tax=Epilithonimonas pallida TaxID=373671 RepID=A0ABY1QXA5_9FLAO|nr:MULTISPECIES: helix-turn-helix transcriptional regulator [Chryseobacterium group]SMP85856.1 Helix-turn-helix [Epilithonimonas pallida]